MFEKLVKMKKKCLCHRFEVENDKSQWRKILASIEEIGPIFHMDFSENVTGTPKFEVQSAHFSKRQHSLHCTVAHNIDNGNASNTYFYHLSDEMRHDYAFTGAVVSNLITYYQDLE